MCANGGEPTTTSGASAPACPATAGATIEWSDASCDDASTPMPVSGGGSACDDGSQPICEDGSQPISSEGSSLSCIAYGAAGSPPRPSAPSGEDSPDASRTLDASAS